MKNIWEIFRRDIKRIKNNVIAMIVIMGITVVPCLYAWFNIAASWDPYGNTGNLKVAVASVDEEKQYYYTQVNSVTDQYGRSGTDIASKQFAA